MVAVLEAVVRRRLVLALLVAPCIGAAQPASTGKRIGFLTPMTPDQAAGLVEGFRQGLREHGYVEGKNIAIEYRFAEGKFDQLPALAAQLVGLRVDVLVAVVTQASIAARDATSTIPIVMVGVSDPIGSKLVATLARPGGNVTGNSALTGVTAGKSLELLKEVAPNARRVGVLWNPANRVFQAQLLRETEAAAGSLNLDLVMFEADSPEGVDRALAAMTKARLGALNVLADPMLTSQASRIARSAAAAGLPSVGWQATYAEAGGLIAYGPSVLELHRDAAAYVAKILAGAKPADLTVEQPTKFDLVINLDTAKQLGVTMPPSLLLRATRIIGQ
ncbi:MAG TPA: ABC transporter substrate-binding protein [Burkholderiales bacterium]|nr:ABC transporter substrate-binding protein [Burkholderiales bacterium]